MLKGGGAATVAQFLMTTQVFDLLRRAEQRCWLHGIRHWVKFGSDGQQDMIGTYEARTLSRFWPWRHHRPPTMHGMRIHCLHLIV